MAIVGDFTVLPDAAGRKNDTKRHGLQPDNGIEVYVLSESSFAIWQTGYVTSSVFESGRIAQGKIAGRPAAGRRCLLSGIQQQVLSLHGEEGRCHRGAALQELDSGMDAGKSWKASYVLDLQLTSPPNIMILLHFSSILVTWTCCFRYLSDRARSISLRYGITVQTNERLRN